MNDRRPSPASQPEQLVILVADDEQLVRDFVAHTLELSGHSVLTAADGEEALEISRRFPGTIHLLISDVMMPRLDGLSLRQKILSERPGVKVLLISGTLEQGIESVPFLQKPFQALDLKRRIEQLIMASRGVCG
jgi:two-component system, cell cycle sensor histidine kinase and response regulator CckA